MDIKALTKELNEMNAGYKILQNQKKELNKEIQNLNEYKEMIKYKRILEKNEAFIERQKYNKLLQNTKEMQDSKKLNKDLREVKQGIESLQEQIASAAEE